jgi:hypothetical protein
MKDILNFDSVKTILQTNIDIISEFRQKYHFEGDLDHLHLFDALIMFYDKQLFDRLDLKLSELSRLKNAYFWYSKYIVVLKRQDFPVSDHEQARFKIIEQIDRLGENIDWLFIKEIDEGN